MFCQSQQKGRNHFSPPAASQKQMNPKSAAEVAQSQQLDLDLRRRLAGGGSGANIDDAANKAKILDSATIGVLCRTQ